MTYQNMYDILMYMKENNLVITKELIQYLKTLPSVSFKEFGVFKHTLPIIEFYFNSQDYYLLSFLTKVDTKIFSQDDITKYSYIINNEKDSKIQTLLVDAFLNYKIRGKEHVLDLICKEKDRDRLFYLTLACKENNILLNPVLFDYINSAPTPAMMQELINSFKNNDIVKNKNYIHYITSQKDAESVSLVSSAILRGIDTHHPDILKEIVEEENSITKDYMVKACVFLSVAKIKELFPLLKNATDDNIKGVIFDASKELAKPSDWQEFLSYYESNPEVLPKILEKKVQEIKLNRNAINFANSLNNFLEDPNSDNISQFLYTWDINKNSDTVKRIRTKDIPF